VGDVFITFTRSHSSDSLAFALDGASHRASQTSPLIMSLWEERGNLWPSPSRLWEPPSGSLPNPGTKVGRH
jgi:hypothetical protein